MSVESPYGLTVVVFVTMRLVVMMSVLFDVDVFILTKKLCVFPQYLCIILSPLFTIIR